MSCLCIIPARGGSKRIPKKNIKNFLGKPIISYSIDIALRSNLFDEVMVSTDDKQIVKISKNNGASVPFLRSNKNSDDFATTFDVIDEVRVEYEKKFEKKFDFYCCIYPTAPLIQLSDLLNGFKIIKEKNSDIVFPITNFSYPIQRSLEIYDHDFVKMTIPKNKNKRSQDLTNYYHDAGQWYWYKYNSIKENRFKKMKYVILDNLHVQDIDNINDLKIAELKYKLINKL